MLLNFILILFYFIAEVNFGILYLVLALIVFARSTSTSVLYIVSEFE